MNRRLHWAVLASLALFVALCLPQAVSACGYECMEVTPGCGRCVYTGDPSTGCRNRPGSCGCYDEIGCFGAVLDPLEQAALDNLGFVPADLQPAAAECASAAWTVAAVAD
ncbi:MAG TPA: hypothetical protein VKM72_09820 [Thermoanaerobaculia bacterium]|nr:hypothetical protein [Thermoanaerobaculia bacterium]